MDKKSKKIYAHARTHTHTYIYIHIHMHTCIHMVLHQIYVIQNYTRPGFESQLIVVDFLLDGKKVLKQSAERCIYVFPLGIFKMHAFFNALVG